MIAKNLLRPRNAANRSILPDDSAGSSPNLEELAESAALAGTSPAGEAWTRLARRRTETLMQLQKSLWPHRAAQAHQPPVDRL